LVKKRHPEITRREFMGSTWKLLNVGAFIALGGHLGSLAVTSISSGHPDSLTCYECRACASPCPWRLDPSGYLVAARVNNPDRRMLAQYNIKRYNRLIGNREEARRMTLDDLLAKDKYMKVVISEVKNKDNIPLIPLFTLDAGDEDHLVGGFANSEIRVAFADNRWAISSIAEVSQEDADNWLIEDGYEKFYIKRELVDLEEVLQVYGEKKEFEKLDPMQIINAKDKIKELEDDGKVAELTDIYEMRAKDSAFYDPLCARCEPVCPVDLPITKFIRDVKADEKYR
jgi:ferredoxin